MRLPKLARFLVLSLIIAATALPAYAARSCSCEFCQKVPTNVRCDLNGIPTTCGAFLIVAICPAEPSFATSEDLVSPAGEPDLACQLGEEGTPSPNS
jgi:hypothetical protein